MIVKQLTLIDRKPVYIALEHIVTACRVNDHTELELVNGCQLIVKETPDEVYMSDQKTATKEGYIW
jgi:uncharacterized protein YlzI (FlbEa/FlbD family)